MKFERRALCCVCVQKQRASLYYLDIISCHSAPQHLVPSGLRVCKTRTGLDHMAFRFTYNSGVLQQDRAICNLTLEVPGPTHELMAGVAPAFKKLTTSVPSRSLRQENDGATHTENATTLPRARSDALRLFSQRCQPFRPFGPSPVTTCIRAGSGGIVAVLARAPRRSPVHNWYGWLDLTTPRDSPPMLGLTRGALLDVRRLCS